MITHTPGPWTVEEYDDEAPTPILVIHRGQTVNRICFMATPGSHGDPAMITADAHLIAAAPDLLEAAKDLARQPCSTVGVEDLEGGCCSSCRARAAVAKATAGVPTS